MKQSQIDKINAEVLDKNHSQNEYVFESNKFVLIKDIDCHENGI